MRRSALILVAVSLVLTAHPAATVPGALDRSFSDDGVATTFHVGSIATAVAVDPAGRIVVGGYTLGGGVDVAVARFLPDGTPDTAFGGGDGRVRVDLGGHDHALDLALLPDGAIALTGVRLDPGGGPDRPFVVRLRPRGTPSLSFSGDGVAFVDFGRPTQATNAIAVTPTGRLVVGGYASNGTGTRSAVARLLPDGSLDAAFGASGRVLLDLSAGSEAIHDLLVVGGDRIVVAGETDVGLQPAFMLARLLGTGALDTAFGRDGGVTRTDVSPGADVGLAIARRSDGKLVVVGRAADGTRNDWGVVRYGGGGNPDVTFAGDGSTVIRLSDASEEATDVMADGPRLIVVGRARLSDTLDLAAVRLKGGGALDTTFGGGDGIVGIDLAGAGDVAHGVALQADGRIVVAGAGWVGTTPRFLVARLRAV